MSALQSRSTISEPEKDAPVSQIKRDPLRKALLLDISGNAKSARRWVKDSLTDFEVDILDKSQIRHESPLSLIKRLRRSRPHTFVLYVSGLAAQSSLRPMLLFGVATGARVIIAADTHGNAQRRNSVAAAVSQSFYLLAELLIGFVFLIPFTWLITEVLGICIGMRNSFGRVVGSERSTTDKPCKSVLYIRATVASTGAGPQVGGSATHARGFINALIRLGGNIELLTLGDSPVETLELIQHRVSQSGTIGPSRAVTEIWNNLRFSFNALEYVQHRGPTEFDFIYQRYSRFNWTGVFLSLATGLPLALEYNGSEVWISRNWDPVGQLWLLGRIEKLNLRAADRVFAVSETLAQTIPQYGSRVVVNPNGVDAEKFKPGSGGLSLRSELGLNNRVVIGFIGTFGPWHGTLVLAKALCQLGRGPSSESVVHALFIGDGEQRSATEAILRSATNAIDYSFLGFVPHEKMPDYLDACDILVSPQLQPDDGGEFFGSPTKVFEYMSMEKAVIVSRVGQLSELIEDGFNGILVNPGDEAGLADSIQAVANDPALRRELGRNARQTVLAGYTWARNAERVCTEMAKRTLDGE